MMIVPYIVLAAAGAIAVKATPSDEQYEQKLEDYMNSGQTLFEAGTPIMSPEDFESRLMDPKYLNLNREKLLRPAPIKLVEKEENFVIPPSFHAREAWPKCESIKLVRNQGNCGSCWAVSAASVMSDRLCIASGQKIQTLLSSTDIISCCDKCPAQPCDGAEESVAWEYIKSHGICSGGPYGRKGVCKPYVFYPCVSEKEIREYGPCNYNKTSPKPMCRKECMQDYKKSYEKDKVRGDYYKISLDNEAIQKEIMRNGPVQATMAVYKNLYTYKNGIYAHKQNLTERRGSHAVKIIGWGVEERKDKFNKKFNVTYWLVSNSWGTDWGENGFFRIVRGAIKLGCEIEWKVYYNYPKIR